MSTSASEYVVIYDISSDKERKKIEKILKGFGIRVQKSVFECKLRKRDLSELTKCLEELTIMTGFVKLYRLEYESAMPVFGKEGDTPDEGSVYVV